MAGIDNLNGTTPKGGLNLSFVGGYLATIIVSLFVAYAILFLTGRHFIHLMDFSLLNEMGGFFLGYAVVSILLYDWLRNRTPQSRWIGLYMGYKIIRIVAFLGFLYAYVFLLNPHNYPLEFIVIAFLVDFFAYIIGDTIYFVRQNKKKR